MSIEVLYPTNRQAPAGEMCHEIQEGGQGCLRSRTYPTAILKIVQNLV